VIIERKSPMKKPMYPTLQTWLILVVIFYCNKGYAFTTYEDSLKNSVLISANFDDYSYSGNFTGNLSVLGNPGFAAKPGVGLELLSTAPNSLTGLKVFKNKLPASSDWYIIVDAHVSEFLSNQQNPDYSAGIMLCKSGANGEAATIASNRVYLNLNRSKNINNQLQQGVLSGIYINGSEDDSSMLNGYAEGSDTKLIINYIAATKTVQLAYNISYAFQGQIINETSPIGEMNLNQFWGLDDSDDLVLVLFANSQPFPLELVTHTINSGDIYLSNLYIGPPLWEGDDESTLSNEPVVSSPKKSKKAKKSKAKKPSNKKPGSAKKSTSKKSGSKKKPAAKKAKKK